MHRGRHRGVRLEALGHREGQRPEHVAEPPSGIRLDEFNMDSLTSRTALRRRANAIAKHVPWTPVSDRAAAARSATARRFTDAPAGWTESYETRVLEHPPAAPDVTPSRQRFYMHRGGVDPQC